LVKGVQFELAILGKIMNGNLLASLQMMVSPVQTLKSVTNLIV
jgi:hypothetical protein